MEAYLVGKTEPAEALAAALRERGVDARLAAVDGLDAALVEIEHELERSRPDAAVVVGADEEALALAITAAKAGVPVAQLSTGSDPANNSARAIATLADLDAGSDPTRAADLIAAWLRGERPSSDLH